ncbi:MAG: GNAT family N-acetyltransferase [Sandaracinaceae bacterium]|nr:GNAT family N-acetyltransferase [Sandaracinaceae bacterium]
MSRATDTVRSQIVEAPLRGLVRLPDTRVIDDDTWRRVITPSQPGSLNEVLRARLAPDAVDEAVERVLSEHAALDVDLKWVVAFDSSPTDALAAALDARGLERWEAAGMWASARLDVAAPDAVLVRPVELDDPELARAFVAGWGGALEDHRALLACTPPTYRFFLASIVQGGASAVIGLAGYVRQPPVAYLTSAVVVPTARGRGAYRALLATRLAAARAEGLGRVVTQARVATSAPILARLGFEESYRFQMFRARRGTATPPR